MTSEHAKYEELAALAAGGYLGDEELRDLQRHAEACPECKNAVAEFRELVHFGLPMAETRVHRVVSMTTSRPDPGATERFIRRASEEGIAFSRDVKKVGSSPRWHLGLAVGAVAFAAMLIAIVYSTHLPFRVAQPRTQQKSMQVQEQQEHLTRQK